MGKYTVEFFKGDYKTRQREASRKQAICYVEQHFNSGPPTAEYSCVIVGSNASSRSKKFAQDYIDLLTAQFRTPKAGKNGIVHGGFNGRGNANVFYTNCPAILLEPLFCSNPKHSEIIKSDRGQEILAEILNHAIRLNFPEGGLVAFSVGHKYKVSSPKDRGAPVYGGGWEADYAEAVLLKAAKLLSAEVKIQNEPVAILFSEHDEVAVAVAELMPETFTPEDSNQQQKPSSIESAQLAYEQYGAKLDNLNNLATSLNQRKDSAKSLWATFAQLILQPMWAVGAWFYGLPREVWLVVAVIAAISIFAYLYRQISLGRLRESARLRVLDIAEWLK
jgi:hypothetical protein